MTAHVLCIIMLQGEKLVNLFSEEFIMIGAMIGDIVGSRFEFYNHKSKDFYFLTKGAFLRTIRL